MADPALLKTGPNDADRAKDYSDRLAKLLPPVLEVMNEAKGHNIEINFQVGQDAIGRITVLKMSITKNLT